MEVPTVRPIQLPTLKHEADFEPSTDAAALKEAIKESGVDEAAIINVLSHRTSYERQQIMFHYAKAYERDLVKDLKRELSEKFEDVVVALMTPLPLFLARELHWAPLGTIKKTLVEILCTQNNASLWQIKNAYYHEYKRILEDDIRSDTSDNFERLLISVCAASRDECHYDTTLAKGIAQQLVKSGEGEKDTRDSEYIRILVSYSDPLLQDVFEEYKQIKGITFGEAIKSELSGDLKMGIEAIYDSFENRSAYFARALHKSMDGTGTDNHSLIRLVVSRCEIDLGNIKQEYQKLYDKSLEQDIEDDTSGDYKKILLALLSLRTDGCFMRVLRHKEVKKHWNLVVNVALVQD